MTRTGPARYFVGKQYEKKSRVRAVLHNLTGPEKAVRPYKKSARTRDCLRVTARLSEMEFGTI